MSICTIADKLRICEIGSDMGIWAKGASIFIGLTTLGAVLTTGLEAEGSSITITGHQRPGTGDPIYEFMFDVTLQNNSPFIQADDYFTIHGLLGVTPANFPASGDQGSSSTAPSSLWSVTIGPVTQSSAPYSSDVTWTYTGSIPIMASSVPVDLGQFTVDTVTSFANPPYADGTLIDYSYNIGGQTSAGDGSFPMLSSIPEPSSLMMLATGTGVVLLLLPVRQHRQNQFLAA
jgi:hypothetical protein